MAMEKTVYLEKKLELMEQLIMKINYCTGKYGSAEIKLSTDINLKTYQDGVQRLNEEAGQ